MSRSCGSSIHRCSGTAPTHTPCAAPARGPVSSDCESCRPRELSPAATAAWASAAERQARSESVGKALPFFPILPVRALATGETATVSEVNFRVADNASATPKIGIRFRSREFRILPWQSNDLFRKWRPWRMRKLHLDTDLGGDIDDLCALAMVLNWPEVELVAVTTVSDDRGKRAGYARYALALAGRRDIPVCAGADISQGYYHPLQPGFPDENAYWPEVIQPEPGPAVDAIALLDRSVEQEATIVAIGPFTNLALLEQRSLLLRRGR